MRASHSTFADYLDELRSELFVLFGRTEASRTVRQILREARAHLEDSYREFLDRGSNEAEAARSALHRFGPAKVVAMAYEGVEFETPAGDETTSPHGASEARRPPGDRWEIDTIMSSLWRDLRMALRGLSQSPGYALAFVLTLGLGIGANTAVFSVVNGIMLKELPHRDGEELVYLRHAAEASGVRNALFSVPEIDDYRQQVDAFRDIAEFSALTFTLLGFEEPRQVRAGIVTGNYFGVMGLTTVAGRPIDTGDDGEGAEPVAVLTYEYWQDTFGGDPGIVDTVARMNERSLRIVGVAEPSPPYPEQTDLFVNMAASPHHLEATMAVDRRHRMTEAFARLQDGVALDTARVQVDQVTARVHAQYPEVYDPSRGFAVTAVPLRDQLAARARSTFLMLLGVAGFVLVIACANVANLTLGRVLRRRDELAVRASLGAGAGALRRQLLIENLVPALLGAVLGLVIARLGLVALVRYAARYSARAAEISIDTTVFLVAIAIGLGAAGFFALIPRLPGSVSRARATTGVSGRTMQRLLVTAQVAVCFVLLIGAGLLLRTVVNLYRADAGLATESVLTMQIPRKNTDPTRDTDRFTFYPAVLERVAALPGVSSAALGTRVPMQAGTDGATLSFSVDFEVVGRDREPDMPPTRADFRPVSEEYFDTVGMALVAGRDFEATDVAESAPVVIINESMAERYFPDRDPLGQQVAWADELLGRFLGVSLEPRTIVGVVSDSSDYGIGAAVPDIIFQPYHQVPMAGVVFIRSAQPSSIVRPALDIIRDLDPERPVINIATLEQVRSDAIAPQRLNATLVGAFALLAVSIAAVGVAGALAFSVSQRVRELGIRAALGADRNRLVRAVLREGVGMTGAGLLLGGAAAVALTGMMSSLLYGVEPTDPATFAGVAAVLLLVAVIASWLPARRASRVDPITALKSDQLRGPRGSRLSAR